jgi:hypothetical protein
MDTRRAQVYDVVTIVVEVSLISEFLWNPIGKKIII